MKWLAREGVTQGGVFGLCARAGAHQSLHQTRCDSVSTERLDRPQADQCPVLLCIPISLRAIVLGGTLDVSDCGARRIPFGGDQMSVEAPSETRIGPAPDRDEGPVAPRPVKEQHDCETYAAGCGTRRTAKNSDAAPPAY